MLTSELFFSSDDCISRLQAEQSKHHKFPPLWLFLVLLLSSFQSESMPTRKVFVLQDTIYIYDIMFVIKQSGSWRKCHKLVPGCVYSSLIKEIRCQITQIQMVPAGHVYRPLLCVYYGLSTFSLYSHMSFSTLILTRLALNNHTLVHQITHFTRCTVM